MKNNYFYLWYLAGEFEFFFDNCWKCDADMISHKSQLYAIPL